MDGFFHVARDYYSMGTRVGVLKMMDTEQVDLDGDERMLAEIFFDTFFFSLFCKQIHLVI